MSQPGVNLDDFVPQVVPNSHGLSRFNVIRACENSLKSFQTDYIDIYLVHRHSPEIPMDETLRALDDLVRQGKIRYIGCSTHPTWAIMESFLISQQLNLNRFVVEESPYNLLDRRIENELIPMAEKYGMGLITWVPMAMGVLAGRYTDVKKLPKDSRATYRGSFYRDRVTQRGIEVGVEFAKIARRIDISPAQLAILWSKDQPGITAPLMGPRTIEQLEELLPVADLTLDDETRAACDELVPPGSVVSDFHNTAPWMKMKVL
jgi:aryl-alcohol dehydrogenase-like predicted oxidoreductase